MRSVTSSSATARGGRDPRPARSGLRCLVCYIGVYVCIYIYTNAHTYSCIICLDICVCVCRCMCVRIYIYIWIYIQIYIYKCIYIYTHTREHTLYLVSCVGSYTLCSKLLCKTLKEGGDWSLAKIRCSSRSCSGFKELRGRNVGMRNTATCRTLDGA